MKKNKLLIPILATASLPFINVCASCSEIQVDDEIKAHDTKSWEHSIQYIASCKHPTIYIGQTASFYIQQFAAMFFGASQYAIEHGYTNSNPDYVLNDQILLMNASAWNYKEAKTPEGNTFGYCFSKFVDSTLGYSDIIAESKQQGKTSIDVTLGNQMLLTNLQDFNCQQETYDKTASDYYEFGKSSEFNIAISRFVNKIMDIYEAVNPDVKFNYVIADNTFQAIAEQRLTNLEVLQGLQRMLKKADKFYICSDGGATWKYCDKSYTQYRKNNGYTRAKKQHLLWDALHNQSDEECQTLLKMYDPRIFYNNESFFYHFSPCAKSSQAPCNLSSKHDLTSDSTLKRSSPYFILESYKDLFTQSQYFDIFMSSYLGLFNFYSSTSTQKFADCVVYDTYKNFDSTKKNLIFILPGAFRAGVITEKYATTFWNECKKIIDKIQVSYPTTEWNYIYKFHPRSTSTDVENALKNLFGGSIPTNTVVLDQTYPFEYLLVLDNYLVKNGKETFYHLIDHNTITQEKPSGILTGFDLESTCFYSAMGILSNEYGYSWDDTKKLVQNDAFYIPKKFSTPGYYINGDNENHYQENVNSLFTYYQAFMELGEFPNINIFKPVD